MNSLVSRLVAFCALLLIGFAVSPLASADTQTLYSNLGPGPGPRFIINREYNSNFNFMATTFTTTGSGNLGDILIPLFSLSDPVELDLYTTSNGVPGSLLESFEVDAPGFPGILTTVTSVDHPFLSADTQYWLVIPLTDSQEDELAWYWNNQGIAGGVFLGLSLAAPLEFVPASPAPAIELDALGSTNTVPDSGYGTLPVGLALVVIASVTFRHRRRMPVPHLRA